MRVQTRIKAVRQANDLVLSQALSAEAQARTVAQYHRSKLVEADAENQGALGRVPEREDFVNGMRSDNFEMVRPGRSIVSRYNLMTEVFAWIAVMLEQNSPKLTGEFSKSHLFFADDVEADPINPPPAKQYVFLSPLPYARKLERGASKQAPDGVFEVTAAMAERKFSSFARHIRFGFRSPLVPRVTRGGGREAVKLERETRAPAIIITP